jgi:fumarylacetoacetate (FAA) hydrolase
MLAAVYQCVTRSPEWKDEARHAEGRQPLQRALDDWGFVAPQLEDLYRTLNDGKARHAFPFDPAACAAPLPRAFQWVDGSAYPNHAEVLARARAAELPETWCSDPAMYQGGSDDFLGPRDPARFASEAWGIDFEAELAAVVDDVPMGATPQDCAQRVRLLLLVNDWSLRDLVAPELAKGFGFLQSKPATAFGPVAVTPDELGDAWRDGRVHLPVLCHWNGRKVGEADAGTDMAFGFPQLVSHLARTRNVRAGSIVGSGTVSNRDRSRGWSCIAEVRALELIESGRAQTGYMRFGDTIRIETIGRDGMSVFGAIEQAVAPAGG